MPYFRPACLALAAVAAAVPARAQNWVYEPDTPGQVYQGQVYQGRVYQGQVYQPRAYDRAYVAPATDLAPPAYDTRAYAPPAYVPDAPVAVTTPAPLALTPAQRTTIYRTIIPQGRGRGPIVKERIVTETIPAAPVVGAPAVSAPVVVAPRAAYAYADYSVGARVADSYALAPLPPAAVATAPAVRSYRYVVINQRLLLVDPATGIIVAELTQ